MPKGGRSRAPACSAHPWVALAYPRACHQDRQEGDLRQDAPCQDQAGPHNDQDPHRGANEELGEDADHLEQRAAARATPQGTAKDMTLGQLMDEGFVIGDLGGSEVPNDETLIHELA